MSAQLDPPDAAPVAAPRAEPTLRRAALEARQEFAAHTPELAAGALEAPVVPFRKGRLSTLAAWFTDATASTLIVVVPPGQLPDSTDTVLAHALALQGDRELLFVLPEHALDIVLNRLPWIATPCQVQAYDTHLRLRPVPVPARDVVLEEYRQLDDRSGDLHELLPEHRTWANQLIASAERHGAVAVRTKTYVSWHLAGLQVLKLASGPSSLSVHAGVQYSSRTGGPPHTRLRLSSEPTHGDLHASLAAIDHDCVGQRSATVDPAEHRLQAAIAARLPAPFDDMTGLLREYAGWRGRDRQGFIDFLAIDVDDHLHVVETKIGNDAAVLLQALDYATWVAANEAELRSRNDWPPAPVGSIVHLDLVLAAKTNKNGTTQPAVNSYLPGQHEALSGDVKLTIYVVDDLETPQLTLVPVTPADLWRPEPGRIAKAVSGPRSQSATRRGLSWG